MIHPQFESVYIHSAVLYSTESDLNPVWTSCVSPHAFLSVSLEIKLIHDLFLCLSESQSPFGFLFSQLREKTKGNPYFSLSLHPRDIILSARVSPLLCLPLSQHVSLSLAFFFRFSLMWVTWGGGNGRGGGEKFWVCNHTNSPWSSPQLALLSTPLKLSPKHAVHIHTHKYIYIPYSHTTLLHILNLFTLSDEYFF